MVFVKMVVMCYGGSVLVDSEVGVGIVVMVLLFVVDELFV